MKKGFETDLVGMYLVAVLIAAWLGGGYLLYRHEYISVPFYALVTIVLSIESTHYVGRAWRRLKTQQDTQRKIWAAVKLSNARSSSIGTWLLEEYQNDKKFKRGIRIFDNDTLLYSGGVFMGIGPFIVFMNTISGDVGFMIVGHAQHFMSQKMPPGSDELSKMAKADVMTWYQDVLDGLVEVPDGRLCPDWHLHVLLNYMRNDGTTNVPA